MTIPNPDHLLEQAERLAEPTRAGAPRQADLRRALSAAYYGLFHAVLAAAADEFVGVSQRTTARYALVYRSVDHRTLKDLCDEARKTTPKAKVAAYLPAGGFGPEIQAFAAVALELQERRHAADYNPLARFSVSDTKVSIATAFGALSRFGHASPGRLAFLTLLVCPPRI